MSGHPRIRRLEPPDATELIRLRREALEAEPLAFAASAEDDVALSHESVRKFLADPTEQAVFGCSAPNDPRLVGMIGVYRASGSKARHKAHGWGLYVAPSARKHGVGRALLEATIAHAGAWGVEQLQLSVSDGAVDARRLYERAGFRPWGKEPRALQWNGRVVDETHLALDLRGPPAR